MGKRAELVAVHGEMTNEGFRVTWDLASRSLPHDALITALSATMRLPWGPGLELSLFLTRAGATVCASEVIDGRARIIEQAEARYSSEDYTIEAVFPRAWLRDYRNEVPITGSLSIDAEEPSSVAGMAFASLQAA